MVRTRASLAAELKPTKDDPKSVIRKKAVAPRQRKQANVEENTKPTDWFDDQIITCAICLEVFHNPMNVQGCNHKFCAGCILEWSHHSTSCPKCRASISNILVDPLTTNLVEMFYKAHPDRVRGAAERLKLDERELFHLKRRLDEMEHGSDDFDYDSDIEIEDEDVRYDGNDVAVGMDAINRVLVDRENAFDRVSEDDDISDVHSEETQQALNQAHARIARLEAELAVANGTGRRARRSATITLFDGSTRATSPSGPDGLNRVGRVNRIYVRSPTPMPRSPLRRQPPRRPRNRRRMNA